MVTNAELNSKFEALSQDHEVIKKDVDWLKGEVGSLSSKVQTLTSSVEEVRGTLEKLVAVLGKKPAETEPCSAAYVSKSGPSSAPMVQTSVAPIPLSSSQEISSVQPLRQQLQGSFLTKEGGNVEVLIEAAVVSNDSSTKQIEIAANKEVPNQSNGVIPKPIAFPIDFVIPNVEIGNKSILLSVFLPLLKNTTRCQVWNFHLVLSVQLQVMVLTILRHFKTRGRVFSNHGRMMTPWKKTSSYVFHCNFNFVNLGINCTQGQNCKFCISGQGQNCNFCNSCTLGLFY